MPEHQPAFMASADMIGLSELSLGVMLAAADCGVACHGGIYVRIRRGGDLVIWDRWRNPDDEVPLREVRFDAEQYEAELARADNDRSWESLGWTVARLLRARLRQDPTVLEQWNSSLGNAVAALDAPGPVSLTFMSPPVQTLTATDHWAQFRVQFDVTDEPAESQAEHIVTVLRASDPRTNAEVCGGYLPHPTPTGELTVWRPWRPS